MRYNESLQRNAEVNQDEEKGEGIKYQCLFSQKGIKWDEQKPLLNDDEYETANKELENLIYYAEHQEVCIDYIWNKPFQDLLHPFIGSDDIRYESNKLEYAYRYFAYMGNIYDGAFRTILNDCRQLIIPVINEIFGEDYTGNEKIEFHPNEHFIDQQDAADQERITDTNFTIFEKIKKKYHLECESSLPDGRMTIRLFEYDASLY